MNGKAGSIPARTMVLFPALLAALLAGCATVSATRDGAENARAANSLSRAERVFLYQSRIADALLDHYPLLEVFEDADPVLVEAEAEMTQSCSPLTRAVLAHFEGRKPSLALRFRVMTSIGACERAARKMDQLLNATARAGSI